MTPSSAWKNEYPGAAIGLLLMKNVASLKGKKLEPIKREIEQELRSRLEGKDRNEIRNLDPIGAYTSYYKRYDKTYHVQLQLESIAFKGKMIPNSRPLVDIMFMAELKNFLLTAGHDWEAIKEPLLIDVAKGTERYVRMNGEEQELKAGDMMISDAQGVISCILHGPDQRTQITSATKNVLYTVYAPPGVKEDLIQSHLQDIESYIMLAGPDAHTEVLTVLNT